MPRLRNNYTEETVVEVLKDWKEGILTAEKISEKHGVPIPTVRNWAKKAGLVKSIARHDWESIKNTVSSQE